METITLKTLPTATAQQVFDQVAKHMLTQMQKSEGTFTHDSEGTFTYDEVKCLYRAEGGLKCAAGCLIADDEYDPEMENKGWPTLVTDGIAPKEHEYLISRLQGLHDNIEPKWWKSELEDIATVFGLVFKGDLYAEQQQA